MKTLGQKREDAKRMKEEYDKLTPQQKIDKLNKKLGVGVGAIKQRERISKEASK